MSTITYDLPVGAGTPVPGDIVQPMSRKTGKISSVTRYVILGSREVNSARSSLDSGKRWRLQVERIDPVPSPEEAAGRFTGRIWPIWWHPRPKARRISGTMPL